MNNNNNNNNKKESRWNKWKKHPIKIKLHGFWEWNNDKGEWEWRVYWRIMIPKERVNLVGEYYELAISYEEFCFITEEVLIHEGLEDCFHGRKPYLTGIKEKILKSIGRSDEIMKEIQELLQKNKILQAVNKYPIYFPSEDKKEKTKIIEMNLYVIDEDEEKYF
jgi:hypothetical protein